MNNNDNIKKTLLKVLCLHGSQQTKEIFRIRLGKFPHKIRDFAECIYCDAPHELELREGDAVPMRTWWKREDFDTTIDKSLTVLQNVWKEQGPFDGLLGFSMGGTMAGIFAATKPEGLQFCIVAGAPDSDRLTSILDIPSLHIYGSADAIVSNTSSIAFSQKFLNPQLLVHEQGHCFPSRADALRTVMEFVKNQNISAQSGPVAATDTSAQEQCDEIEAMTSIYPDRLEILIPPPQHAGEPCAKVSIPVACESNPKLHLKISLVFEYSSNYPEEVPKIQLEHSLDGLTFPTHVYQQLLQYVRNDLEQNAGMPVLFMALGNIESWIQDEMAKVVACKPAKAQMVVEQDEDEDEEAPAINDEVDDETEQENVSNATIEACHEVARRLKQACSWGEPKRGRGVKQFVVGLVGKPSAGKSTFFNCITKLQNPAKVAAHPFTTIEPNYGFGWWVSNDENDLAGGSQHGRDSKGRRFIPVQVKDVAGLIPGAYQGKGKGNKFLNDLCDADVLIHVVDVSGSCDRNGNKVSAGDNTASSAEEDVRWLREELHRWIFGNVHAKWYSVIRYAKVGPHAVEERLLELLSGYQGQRSCVKAAMERAKLQIADAKQWTRYDLHRLVAHFLSVRFPMCLALNKCDKLVDRDDLLRRAYEAAASEGYRAVPCSAKTETELIRMSQAGLIHYDLGSHELEVSEDALAKIDTKGKAVIRDGKYMIDKFGSTGVLQAISETLWLQQPLFVYPVRDFSTGMPLDPGAKRPSDAYRDCATCLPGTTVADIVHALTHGCFETYRLCGDFIRAEAQCRDGSHFKQVGKEHLVDKESAVLKIMLNKKVAWQKNLGRGEEPSESK